MINLPDLNNYIRLEITAADCSTATYTVITIGYYKNIRLEITAADCSTATLLYIDNSIESKAIHVSKLLPQIAPRLQPYYNYSSLSLTFLKT